MTLFRYLFLSPLEVCLECTFHMSVLLALIETPFFEIVLSNLLNVFPGKTKVCLHTSLIQLFCISENDHDQTVRSSAE